MAKHNQKKKKITLDLTIIWCYIQINQMKGTNILLEGFVVPKEK